MKPLTWRQIASAIVLATVSTAGSAATMMANNSNKGSLLMFPRIDVRPGIDTLLTIVNDGSTDVQVKCYYRSSEPLPTPLPSTFNTAFIKHTMDFTFTLTRNQTLAWSAATGVRLGGATQVAAPFTSWPDGSGRQTGMMACWAIGADRLGNITQINFNQLFGNASIVGAPFGVQAQAYEYNAWAFQALAGTAGQGQPVGNTPGQINLFTTTVTRNIVLNPSASNIGCIVTQGPNVGNACGPVGLNPAFTTDNAHLAFTGLLDIANATGTSPYAEAGMARLLDFDLANVIFPASLTGLDRSQGGNYDIYALFSITGNGVWVSPVNFVTTSVATVNITLVASPAGGTPPVFGTPISGSATTAADIGVTFGSKDFVLGTATVVTDPTNFGVVSLGNGNQATTSLLALLSFTPQGGPSGPLTGPTGFFQAPTPFLLGIGSQSGGNPLNTTWAPFGAGVRITVLNFGGGGSFSFVATEMSGYDSCPNILVGDFQAGGVVGGRGALGTPAAGPVFAGGVANTTISVNACNQDFTQRARPFITKYTWTFWNEDESSRTGTHECGDSYYETYFPAAAGNGVAPNPGPFVGFPFAQWPGLGTPTGYFRIESTPDTAVCANAVNFGLVGVIAHANNGVYVRGSNLIGRGTTSGLITWDPGPPDSFKK